MNWKAVGFAGLRRPGLWCVAIATATVVTALCRPVWAYTPNSPEVREMLARGIAYLEKADRNGPHSGQLGGKALMGLAAYKYDKRFGNGGDPLPPLTSIALGEVLGQARAASLENQGFVDNYSLGIALIFLTEVNPTDHMDAIIAMAEELKKRQKANGAWGYSHEKRGDSSQLQYAALGLWAAKKVADYNISNDVMDRLVNYLIRVQDPSGGWGYQGNDPGGFTRLPQEQVRHSLCAAGLGSLYVAADFLGMSRQRKVKERKSLPPALMPVVEDRAGEGGKLAGTSVDVDRMRAAMNDGNNWFRQNFTTRTNMWQYYYLYGLERYHSFREMVEGTYEEEPRWYNEGVRTLRELQANHGGWGLAVDLGASPVGSDPAVETAFAILFLLRSTRDTIETVIERDGVLSGGHDLPSDVSDVRMRNNKIVAPAITGEVADMISMLEDDDAVNIENLLENPDALSLSNIKGEGVQFRERLGRVLRNGSYMARIVAARTLSRQGALENVPMLIYALTDEDPRVVKEASDGLRLVSRKFDGFGMSANPAAGEKEATATAWKAWYKSIQPDAVFIQ